MNNNPAHPGGRSAARWCSAAALVTLLLSACTPAASPTTRSLITPETPLQNTQDGLQGSATIPPSVSPVSPTATVPSIPPATPLPPAPQPTPTFNPAE